MTKYIIFDCELGRPACVLIQAAYGIDSYIAHEFPPNTWLISPTANMKRYKIENEDQLEKLIKLAILSTEKQGPP